VCVERCHDLLLDRLQRPVVSPALPWRLVVAIGKNDEADPRFRVEKSVGVDPVVAAVVPE
jgi:hypothetical protein